MAYRYFSGTTQGDGLRAIDNSEFKKLFPGIEGIKSDSFSRFVTFDSANKMMPVTRMIDYKKNPSLHKCDSRCQSARGRTCECSCGGANHGAMR